LTLYFEISPDINGVVKSGLEKLKKITRNK